MKNFNNSKSDSIESSSQNITNSEFDNHRFLSINEVAKMHFELANLYLEKGNFKSAKEKLLIAHGLFDSENDRTNSYNCLNLLIALDKSNGQSLLIKKQVYDLVFNSKKKEILEKSKGSISLKNQFILVEIMSLFLQFPGNTFSKEYLVEKVWGEEYNPVIHDNKVYVTINRLRKIIEPNSVNPIYIFRNKTGYFFSDTVKSLLVS